MRLKRDVELLMFDLDGTLVDSTLDLAQSANFVRRYFGLTPLPVSRIRSFIGDGAWQLIERSLEGLPSHQLAEGFQVYKKHYAEHSTDFTHVYPGCLDLLRYFQNKKIAIVTNKPDVMSCQVLKAYGLAPYIGYVVGGDTARKKKPAPDHLRQALEWSGCEPDEALMVGDSSNDVEAAVAAGIACCGMTSGIGKPVGRAGQRPDFTIEHLAELKQHVARS